MKTHIAFKKNFEKYRKECEQYLEQFKSIQPPKEEIIPKFTEDDHGSCYAYLKTDFINQKNSKKIHNYESAQKEIKRGKKNLATLMNSPTKWSLVIYDRIPTINWGKVSIQEYAKYLKGRLRDINWELSQN